MPLSARILPAALAFALALSLTPTAPLFAAYAHAEETASTETAEDPTALVSSGDETASPCLPSESELQAYAEDGTLDQRLAYQESLGNEEYDAGLIESAAAARQPPPRVRPRTPKPSRATGRAAWGRSARLTPWRFT